MLEQCESETTEDTLSHKDSVGQYEDDETQVGYRFLNTSFKFWSLKESHLTGRCIKPCRVRGTTGRNARHRRMVPRKDGSRYS